MKRKPVIICAGLIAVIACCTVLFIMRRKTATEGPEDRALGYAEAFAQAIASPAAGDVRRMVTIPVAYRQRTDQEQEDFIRKALRDEISAEGLDVMREIGEFGPLREIFPAKAEDWTSPLGISPDDCVAFRATKGGVQAELVLFVAGEQPRIVRCNNVRQLAD